MRLFAVLQDDDDGDDDDDDDDDDGNDDDENDFDANVVTLKFHFLHCESVRLLFQLVLSCQRMTSIECALLYSRFFETSGRDEANIQFLIYQVEFVYFAPATCLTSSSYIQSLLFRQMQLDLRIQKF